MLANREFFDRVLNLLLRMWMDASMGKGQQTLR